MFVAYGCRSTAKGSQQLSAAPGVMLLERDCQGRLYHDEAVIEASQGFHR